MPISLHKQATPTPKIRTAIQASTDPDWMVAAARGEDIFAEIPEQLLAEISSKTQDLAAQGLVPTGFRRLV